MIEKLVREFLFDKLNIPVYTEEPLEPPKKCVVIERTGQTRTNLIYESVIAVKTYGGTMYDAASLNRDVNELMLDDFISLKEISAVTMNSSTNFTDTARKKPRYQSVFVIKHY